MGRISKDLLKRWDEHKARILSESFRLEGNEAERTKRVERARRDYAFFVSTYFPHLAKSPTAKFQIEAANHIKHDPKAFALFEWARGMAKSTHISLMIPIWLYLQEERTMNLMLLASKSQDMAMQLLLDIQLELLYNEHLRYDFGDLRGSGSWKNGRFEAKGGVLFVSVGRDQSPRGLKMRGQRPNYIVVDDLDDDDLVRSGARISKAYDWMMSALYGTMDAGRGRFIMVGNRIGKDSILARFAARGDVHHTTVNMLTSMGTPTWHENHSEAEIAAMKTKLGDRLFEKEYMNNPISEGMVFRRSQIQYRKMLPLNKYRSLICYTDPSWKSTSKNDYKATVLVGKSPTGEYHVLKVFAAQTSVSNMVAWHYDLKDYVDGKVPIRFYMEANFVQDLLLDEFRKEGERRGLHIPIVQDSRKKSDKFARIEAMQPLFERGLVILNIDEQQSTGMQTLEEQLLMIEPGSKAHDDAPDALEGAIFLLNRRNLTGAATYIVGARPNRHY